MTTITLPRAVVEQALEAMEYFRDTAICAADTDTANETIPILRTALAQQAEPVEPVAWYYERDTDKGLSFAPDRDPYKCWQPLHTAPPQRKPLPKHDQHCVDVPGYGLMAVRLVRAVERAHGIGGNNG